MNLSQRAIDRLVGEAFALLYQHSGPARRAWITRAIRQFPTEARAVFFAWRMVEDGCEPIFSQGKLRWDDLQEVPDGQVSNPPSPPPEPDELSTGG